MPTLFRRNVPAGQPTTSYQKIPGPGGASAEEQSSVYEGFYGDMPVPATQYASSVAAVRSVEIVPSVANSFSNASFVDRHDRRNGIVATGGRQLRKAPTPQYNNPVFSSEFQKHLIGPHVNFILNGCLYRAGYPAATISQGTDRNLALSERVPQLSTRTTGGPGPGAMLPSPRFKAVQTVPRYSTMPPTFPTTPTSG